MNVIESESLSPSSSTSDKARDDDDSSSSSSLSSSSDHSEDESSSSTSDIENNNTLSQIVNDTKVSNNYSSQVISTYSSSTLKNNTIEKNACTSNMEDDEVVCDHNNNNNGLSLLKIQVSQLPPLPKPNVTKRRESLAGITLVTVVTITFIGITHGVSLSAIKDGIERKSSIWWMFFILIYGEATLAFLCLLGILLSDPGVVKRSPETCFPFPIQVEAYINAYVAANEDDNTKETKGINDLPTVRDLYIPSPLGNGDTYCVRCLVWRKCHVADGHDSFSSSPNPHNNNNNNTNIKYFHCSTCQRCVEHFDHHCSVFGRCIAGRIVFGFELLLLRRGNFVYFVGIIAVGVLAYFTTAVSLIWSLSIRFDPKWVVPVSIVVLFFVTTNFLNRTPNRYCLPCRRFVLQIDSLIRNLCCRKWR